MAQRTTSTRYGRLRGTITDDVASYLGIPYAKPPLGELRFRPPSAPDAWRGVRSATEFGPIAPQPASGLGSYIPGDPTDQDEDCLTLNIWSPLGRPALCPVMVFFHGGSFLSGSGAGVMYRGDALARSGVVVVTFNYRLGALGFLAHHELRDDSSPDFGNWGLFDQLAVLAWIRDNIGAFGGDATKLTCFGESAGAMSISNLLASPFAEGLFQRAILQSGAALADDPEDAEAVAKRFGTELGLSRLSRQKLAGIPLEELLGAQTAAGANSSGELMPFKPVIDGRVLPVHPAIAIAKGSSKDIDLIVGTNRDEFKLFSFAAPQLAEMDDVMLERLVGGYVARRSFSDAAPSPAEIIDCYRQARQARNELVGPRDLLDAIATDVIFRLPLLRLAEGRRVSSRRSYAYLFEWASPFAGGALGSCHGLELPFVFNTLDNPAVAMFAGASTEAVELANKMQAAWVAFASSGDPSHAELGCWQAYEARRRTTMIFGSRTRLEDGPLEIERRFWQDRLPRYGEESSTLTSGRGQVAPHSGA